MNTFAERFIKAFEKSVKFKVVLEHFSKHIIFVFVHIYPPFTRKQIVSLYFGRDVKNGAKWSYASKKMIVYDS